MKKHIFILFFVMVLLASFATAEPPVTTVFSGDMGLTIEAPVALFVQVDTDADLHTHVFNTTDGLTMNNATTSCFVHLYNETGSHIMEEDMGFDSNGLEFELLIGGGNFTLGRHGFIIVCNTSQVGGFVRGGFEVTRSGYDETPRDNSTGIGIVIFILVLAIALFGFSMKEEILKNKYANIIVRRSLLVLGIYFMILNSAIMATLAASSNLPLVQEMFFYMKVIGYLGYPAMVLLMMTALLQALNDMKKDKKNKRTGEEHGE